MRKPRSNFTKVLDDDDTIMESDEFVAGTDFVAVYGEIVVRLSIFRNTTETNHQKRFRFIINLFRFVNFDLFLSALSVF